MIALKKILSHKRASVNWLYHFHIQSNITRNLFAILPKNWWIPRIPHWFCQMAMSTALRWVILYDPFFSFFSLGIRWYIISVSIAGPWGNGKEKQWYYYMPKNKFCLHLHRSDQGIYILSLHWDHWSGLYSRSFNPYMAVAWYIIAGPCPRTQLHMSNVHILVK